MSAEFFFENFSLFPRLSLFCKQEVYLGRILGPGKSVVGLGRTHFFQLLPFPLSVSLAEVGWAQLQLQLPLLALVLDKTSTRKKITGMIMVELMLV